MFGQLEHRRERMTPRASRWRFWATAYALLILLTGTNLATPLYHGYEARFGFSPLVVTLSSPRTWPC
jgi:hypothetical protein